MLPSHPQASGKLEQFLQMGASVERHLHLNMYLDITFPKLPCASATFLFLFAANATIDVTALWVSHSRTNKQHTKTQTQKITPSGLVLTGTLGNMDRKPHTSTRHPINTTKILFFRMHPREAIWLL
jgi:hypothetical protein